MQNEMRADQLRTRLGEQLVNEFLAAADRAGRSYFASDEDPVFGFLQRALVSLKNAGNNRGMLFPKTDRAYRRFYDYFDGDGRIFVIYTGTGSPELLPVDSAWVQPIGDYLEIPEGYAREIMLAFLEVYAHLRLDHPGTAQPLQENSPRP